MVYAMLAAPQAKVLAAILGAREISRTDLAELVDYSASSGNFGNILGKLRSLELIEYPRTGVVSASAFLYIES